MPMLIQEVCVRPAVLRSGQLPGVAGAAGPGIPGSQSHVRISQEAFEIMPVPESHNQRPDFIDQGWGLNTGTL